MLKRNKMNDEELLKNRLNFLRNSVENSVEASNHEGSVESSKRRMAADLTAEGAEERVLNYSYIDILKAENVEAMILKEEELANEHRIQSFLMGPYDLKRQVELKAHLQRRNKHLAKISSTNKYF